MCTIDTNRPMDVREIEDKKQWNTFVGDYTPNTFLQSWQWGEFLKSQDHHPFRLGLFEGDELIGTALFTKIMSKRANYLDCHGAPMIDWNNPEQFAAFEQYLEKLAQRENIHFFRFRAPMHHDDAFVENMQQQGYKLAPMYFQAEYTMVLDLTRSEDEIMANMRKNTRYYVRRSEREGVKVRISQDPQDLKVLFELYQETVERQEFIPYDFDFFKTEFEIFHADDLTDIYIAEYDGKPVAAAMMVYFDKGAYYHHGASIRLENDVYAPYLLQWEAIKNAKRRGMETYDFFGVAPNDDEDHPRAGLTKFKRGFGGERVRWMHTLDYPVNPLRYWIMYWFVRWERRKRGL